MDRAALAALEEAYDVEHEKTYGHRAGCDEPVELVTLKVIGHGVPDVPRTALAATAERPEGVLIAQPLRRAYFGPTHGWCDTAIINRSDLREPRAGPCIIEECDSTASCRPARPRTSTRSGISLSMCVRPRPEVGYPPTEKPARKRTDTRRRRALPPAEPMARILFPPQQRVRCEPEFLGGASPAAPLDRRQNRRRRAIAAGTPQWRDHTAGKG